MFVDVEGSTKLYEKCGDQKAQKIIERCLDIVSNVVKQSGGIIIKFIGDEVMCHFTDVDTALEVACKIQETIEYHSRSETLPSIRIGFHYGAAIEKDGDIYGDAVNMAARVASIAKGKQIITTEDTVYLMSARSSTMIREFDKTPIKGKEGESTIYEVLWQPDGATAIRTSIHGNLADGTSLLSISYDGKEFNIKANAANFLIGRDARCDLIVNSDFSSRMHAHIEYRRGKFVLVDQSTNGTYVSMDKNQDIYLRREDLPLVGVGRIGLGEAAKEECKHIIRYVCI